MTLEDGAASRRLQRIASVATLNFVFRRPTVWKLSQRMNKHFYPYLTRRLGGDQLALLNFGYEENPPMDVPLSDADEADRFYIQLYHRTATQAELRGERVLEVGCGHGGGASYLLRTLQPASYTGLDANPAGVALCREQHPLPGLDFVHGDAEDLPFDDSGFGAVINIESSHCYPQFPRFLDEVARVLRPGGHFLYADYRPRSCLPEWDAALASAPLRLISAKVINSEVLRGMEKSSARILGVIDRQLPAIFRPSAREISGIPGSYTYNNVRDGGVSYRMYCFTKD
jgi:fatty-acid O-methyltransferase